MVLERNQKQMNKAVGAMLLPILMILPTTGMSNDFPTADRVSHVISCMEKNGGQSVQNLYTCSCRLDALAGDMKFAAYEEAINYEAFRRMPGEKGGVYRDSEAGEKAVVTLNEARTASVKNCPIVRHIGAKPVEGQ